MDPANFPKELRSYFLNTPSTEDRKGLNVLFTKHPSVREIFVEWTRNHQSLVENTPRLYQALDIATDSSIEWSSVAKTVNSMYLWFRDDGSTSYVNDVLAGVAKGSNFPDNFGAEALILFEAGIIDKNQLKKLFWHISNETTFVKKFEVIKNALPYLEKLEGVVFAELFSIKYKHAETLLHDEVLVALLLPVLEKLEGGILIELFSTRDKYGRTPLDTKNILKTMLPVLEKLEAGIFIELFSIKNASGKTPLHRHSLFVLALPLLRKLEAEKLNILFSIQYERGNTLLHDPKMFDNAFSLFDKLKPETLKIRNDRGFTPEQNRPLLTWLFKTKAANTVKPLSEKEYQEKAQLLKQVVDELWSSLIFGENAGNVNKEYLNVNISGNETFTPEQIKEKLDVIIEKIVHKKAWLGTPREEEKEQLHNFYSQMLMNFEQVVTQLKKEDNSSKAGTLISIAKVQLEGRCAAAYQSEIEQAKMVLDSDLVESGLDAAFNKLAKAILIDIIEKIVQRNSGGDSHDFSQMLFSVGMAQTADPLAKLSLELCQNLILNEWKKDRIAPDFKESLERFDSELLQHWFELNTPEKYGTENRTKQIEIKTKEQEINQYTKAVFTQQGLEGALSDHVLKIFESSQGGGLRMISPKRTLISEAVFQKFNQALTPNDIQGAEIIVSQENEADKISRQELQKKIDDLKTKPAELLNENEKKDLAILVKKRLVLQQKSIGIANELRALKLFSEAKIRFKELVSEINLPFSQKNLDAIVAEKISYDKKIEKLAGDNEIDFTARENGLPSKALEHIRRQKYAAQFFDENKINEKGAFKILIHIGVF